MLPRSEPLTFDLPPVRGPYPTSRSTTRQPASAARTSSSSGYPDRRSRHPGPTAHRGAPPASARCRAPAARGGCAAASSSPRCPPARPTATAARGTGRRRPIAMSAPRSSASTSAGKSPASIEPSASMTATIGVVAATTPACTADPYPARNSVTTSAPCRRATSAVSSVLLLSTTNARYPGGTPPAPPAATPPR